MENRFTNTLVPMEDKAEQNILFRNVKNYPRYIVRQTGFVIKNPYIDLNGVSRNGRVIREKTSQTGYSEISFVKDKKIKTKLLHRIVATAFVENPENKPQVNHIDGDKLNNHFSNLEWATDKENKEHSKKMGLNAKGTTNGLSKLNPKIVLQVREMLKKNILIKDIAKIYKVDASTISSIKHGKTWSHVKI